MTSKSARTQIAAAISASAIAACAAILSFASPASAAVTCNGLAPTINQRTATTPQVIKGTANPDVIVGGKAGDTIYGFGNDDVICGGAGEDLIKSGSGDDEVLGQSDSDTLKSGSGDDEVDPGSNGGEGAAYDEVFAGDGGDTLVLATFELAPGYLVAAYLGDGADSISLNSYFASSAEVHGQAGDDDLFVRGISIGGIYLYGGSGSDFLRSSEPDGYSRLVGGLGDDLMANADLCVGGEYSGQSSAGDKFFNCTAIE